MKVYNENNTHGIETSLADAMMKARAARHFEVELYVQTKAKLLNEYLRKSKLSSCVVAVSGGVDSAIVLGLVHYASKLENSPIKKIVPLMLPVFNTSATTNQDSATQKGIELCEKLGLHAHVIDLSHIHPLMKQEVDSKIGIVGDDWAAGQLVAYLRTPAIYYTTSLMSQSGTGGVVVGTTNRDEGAYLGYVGKASDGMVDIQLISDLHKSEVYQVARYLQLPESILNAIPTGDMYDGRVDEEVFGATYDFVELYLYYLCCSPANQLRIYDELTPAGKEQFDYFKSHLENLHGYNKHKYLIGSPAVHLDIYKSDVPGGWTIQRDHSLISNLDFSKINGYVEVPADVQETFLHTGPAQSPTKQPIEGISPTLETFTVNNLLSKEQCNALISGLDESKWISVGFDGFKSSLMAGSQGSQRQTIFNKEIADYVWSRLNMTVSTVKNIHPFEIADADGCSVWRAIGLSPLFRFIRYKKGDLLIPHYDAPFKYDNKTTTLMTVVMYLTDNPNEGGQTRFLQDNQVTLPADQRDYADWKRFATPDEVIAQNTCVAGSALVMDHRILHDSAEYTGDGYKLIIRTDIVYTKCVNF